MPGVRPPMIGIKAREPEGFQQRFEPQKNLVLPTPKNIRQDGTSVVIDGMPQPAWIPLVAVVYTTAADNSLNPKTRYNVPLIPSSAGALPWYQPSFSTNSVSWR